MRSLRTLTLCTLIGLASGGSLQADEVPPLLTAPGRPPAVTRVPPKPPALAGNHWRIIAYFDGVAMAAPKYQSYTLPPNAGQTVDVEWPTVDFNGNSVLRAYTGCGSTGGHYEITDDKVKLGAVTVITGGCGTNETRQVFAIADAMKASEKLIWRGESALLFDHVGNLQLILSR